MKESKKLRKEKMILYMILLYQEFYPLIQIVKNYPILKEEWNKWDLLKNLNPLDKLFKKMMMRKINNLLFKVN